MIKFIMKYIKKQKRECDIIYSETHKEQVREIHRQYQERNKEKIREHKSTKYICSCGSELTIAHKLRHERSKKHQEFIKEQQE